MGSNVTKEKKCYNLWESSLTFVDREDDLDCSVQVVNDTWPTFPYFYRMTLGTPSPLPECKALPSSFVYMVQPVNGRGRDPGQIHTATKDCGLTQEKSYDPCDPTLTFVNRDDDLDFLCEGFKSRRALMSCGHAVTPTSLTNWCRTLLEQGDTRFICGQNGCNVEWSYTEVCKMALLTPEEMQHFQSAMAYNAARQKSISCPGCKLPVVRQTDSDLRVHCTVCTANRRRIYDFCWQCLKEWKGPSPRSDRCDNDGCTNESLKTLRKCPDNLIDGVVCPSIRACPTCGILIQHDNTACRDVTCPRCKVEFCFVCLSLSVECNMCDMCDVGPRQMSIPVWQRP